MTIYAWTFLSSNKVSPIVIEIFLTHVTLRQPFFMTRSAITEEIMIVIHMPRYGKAEYNPFWGKKKDFIYDSIL